MIEVGSQARHVDETVFLHQLGHIRRPGDDDIRREAANDGIDVAAVEEGEAAEIVHLDGLNTQRFILFGARGVAVEHGALFDAVTGEHAGKSHGLALDPAVGRARHQMKNFQRHPHRV